MKKESFLVISFYDTANALYAKRVCLNNNIQMRLIPTPRAISAGCGISIKTDVSNKELILDTFNRFNVDYEKMTEL